ncbi:unnamed protein product [Cuscuta campestris]|uniref:Uncharacterized protein n=1 Tax=Cuscuta campestris TaxID=132261 RepID=A0A484LAL5_9ASTE|nr:unnamed protein product [Cuscuta campestris]
MLQDTIKNMCGGGGRIPKCFRMADLGCSSGPNALLPTINMMDAVREACPPDADLPEFQAFLNDLPDNDFNAIFRSIPNSLGPGKNHKCSVAAVAGSFYDKLFPSNSLHFVHSSYSLHWLSQVPEGIDEKMNKRDIYIGESSPTEVVEAYVKQYEKDLTAFLRYRADELKPGGRMVLVLLGRGTPLHTGTPYLVDPLTEALLQFVSEGLIEEEKLVSLNVPSYSPHKDEMKEIIEKEGSFTLDRLEVTEMNWDNITGVAVAEEDGGSNGSPAAKFLTKTIRAVMEPMVAAHFGESVVDPLFLRYEQLVARRLAAGDDEKKDLKFWNLSLSLTKKSN